jgi:glycosyltransferase involved in cell wall biosynthesis
MRLAHIKKGTPRVRIGMMLRALDEKGGIGVYSRYLTEELLTLDRQNTYVLYYRNRSHIGRFVHQGNVVERILPATNNFVWDQISVPFACQQDKVDVVLHPKFTVPLAARCKTVMVLHGAGWFIPEFERFWKPMDLRYIKAVMPLYCRKASAILSVSQLTTDIYTQRFALKPGKIRTVYFGPGRQFHPITDPASLDRVRARYGLPERFVLTLSKYPGGDRKNIAGILRAYALLHGRVAHSLVVGGKDCERFRGDYDLPKSGYARDIVFPGYIAQEDLPAVYSMADLFLYPSNMEAFPIPLTEAMACGTPVVTSNGNGLREIAGEAALQVDARNPEAIAEAAHRVLTDPDLRAELSRQALARSGEFSWSKCARETLSVLEGLTH